MKALIHQHTSPKKTYSSAGIAGLPSKLVAHESCQQDLPLLLGWRASILEGLLWYTSGRYCPYSQRWVPLANPGIHTLPGCTRCACGAFPCLPRWNRIYCSYKCSCISRNAATIFQAGCVSEKRITQWFLCSRRFNLSSGIMQSRGDKMMRSRKVPRCCGEKCHEAIYLEFRALWIYPLIPLWAGASEDLPEEPPVAVAPTEIWPVWLVFLQSEGRTWLQGVWLWSVQRLYGFRCGSTWTGFGHPEPQDMCEDCRGNRQRKAGKAWAAHRRTDGNQSEAAIGCRSQGVFVQKTGISQLSQSCLNEYLQQGSNLVRAMIRFATEPDLSRAELRTGLSPAHGLMIDRLINIRKVGDGTSVILDSYCFSMRFPWRFDFMWLLCSSTSTKPSWTFP